MKAAGGAAVSWIDESLSVDDEPDGPDLAATTPIVEIKVAVAVTVVGIGATGATATAGVLINDLNKLLEVVSLREGTTAWLPTLAVRSMGTMAGVAMANKASEASETVKAGAGATGTGGATANGASGMAEDGLAGGPATGADVRVDVGAGETTTGGSTTSGAGWGGIALTAANWCSKREMMTSFSCKAASSSATRLHNTSYEGLGADGADGGGDDGFPTAIIRACRSFSFCMASRNCCAVRARSSSDSARAPTASWQSVVSLGAVSWSDAASPASPSGVSSSGVVSSVSLSGVGWSGVGSSGALHADWSDISGGVTSGADGTSAAVTVVSTTTKTGESGPPSSSSELRGEGVKDESDKEEHMEEMLWAKGLAT